MGSSLWKARFVAVLFVVSLALTLPGCGGSKLALTGGSIPIGVSRLKGLAMRADDIGRPISGAAVVMSQGQVSTNTFTNAEGEFTFDKFAGGVYLCTIFPPEDAGVRPWSFNVQVPDGETSQLLARMIPTASEPAFIQRVEIVPKGYTLNIGESVKFSAQAYDQANDVLTIRGSLFLSNEIGELNADGTLIATEPGTAVLSGWAGNYADSVPVHVLPQ